MLRRIALCFVLGLATLVGGCMIVVKDLDSKAKVVDIDGQKYVIDEEGNAHKLVE